MSTIPLSQAKTHLAKLLAEVEELGEEVVITRSGRPAGVLLSVGEYEGLLETLSFLEPPEGGPRRSQRDAQLTSRLLRREMIAASSGQIANHCGCRTTFCRIHLSKVPKFGTFVE